MLQFKRSRAAAPGTECPDRVAEKPLRRAGLHYSAEHSGRYCQTAPCSSYSAFWHTVAVGEKTYGFACDDHTGQSCGFNSPDARYVQVQSAGNPVRSTGQMTRCASPHSHAGTHPAVR